MKTDIYSIAEASIPLQSIQREVKRLCFEQRLDPSAMMDNLELRMLEDETGRYLIRELMAKVATKKFDVKTLRFPSDWWECFKQRFFPMWATVKWPIKYTEITMEANAYNPDLRIPNHETFVEIQHRAREAYYTARYE